MRNKLKVAHVLVDLGIGGMEKVVVDIIKRFDKKRIQSIVYCLEKKGEYAERLEACNIEVYQLQKKKFPFGYAFALAGLFKKRRINVVHSHSGIYRDATLAGLIARIPAIMHTDHGRFYPNSQWTKFNHWLFSHFRNKIITVSDELKKFVISEVKINPNKVVRIYNGVNMADFCLCIDIDEKKKRIKISPDEKVIGIVARLVSVKDHETLFFAFKEVKEKFGNVKLLVVGDGPLHERLRLHSESLGLNEDIIFLGNRGDVAELLYIMDVVCLSSLNEGHSITLIEAMASKKAVVATNVGGNPESIEDGVNGILVPPRNHKKMAEAIIKLLKNDELRQSMGMSAKQRIKKHFNIDKVAMQYENLYFELTKLKGNT